MKRSPSKNKATDKYILTRIEEIMEKKGDCPTVDEIASTLSMPKEKAYEHIERLAKKGILGIENRVDIPVKLTCEDKSVDIIDLLFGNPIENK